jgi:hypothetical protein
MDPDLAERADLLRDALREERAIHGQGAARGHAHGVGDPDDERVHPAHLFLQQPRGLVERVAAQAVRAHQLGQVIGLMHRRRLDRPHLVEVHGDPPPRELPRRLGTGEPPTDDGYALNHCFSTQRPRRARRDRRAQRT